MILRSKKTYNSDFYGVLTKDEIKNNLKWINNGIYYGYPMCCIVFFIKNFSTGKLNGIYNARKPIKPIHQMGYIPCDVCYCKLDSGLNIHKLLVNRKCHATFPGE